MKAKRMKNAELLAHVCANDVDKETVKRAVWKWGVSTFFSHEVGWNVYKKDLDKLLKTIDNIRCNI